MLWSIAFTLAMGLSAFLVYLYYLRKGQFENLEEVKYQIFHEEE